MEFEAPHAAVVFAPSRAVEILVWKSFVVEDTAPETCQRKFWPPSPERVDELLRHLRERHGCGWG
jgi:hypothetical protein